MKRFALIATVALFVGFATSARETRAGDDLEFATPAVANQSPACANGTCLAPSDDYHNPARSDRRRPILDRQPVRRVLRGTLRLLGCR